MGKIRLHLSLLLICCVPAVAGAQDGGFWSQLGGKLEQLTPQKKTIVTSAVGGVRGAKDLSADALYWKGEKAQQTIDAVEYERFRQALAAGEAGKPDAAAEFEGFLRDFPQSSLREDAVRALQLLQAAAAPVLPPPPATQPTDQAQAPAPAQ